MRKILIITLILAATLLYSNENEPVVRKNLFAISSGTEYLDNDFYFNFGLSSIIPLNGDKEFDMKLAINLITKEGEDGAVEPRFNVPLKLGINFLFPANEKVIFLTGLGISPTIRVSDDDKFLIGPNVKAGLRYKVHPTMNIIFEVTQSLLIGPPKWMYPSTEIVAGVNFYL